jgi:hypothetical protein
LKLAFSVCFDLNGADVITASHGLRSNMLRAIFLTLAHTWVSPALGAQSNRASAVLSFGLAAQPDASNDASNLARQFELSPIGALIEAGARYTRSGPEVGARARLTWFPVLGSQVTQSLSRPVTDSPDHLVLATLLFDVATAKQHSHNRWILSAGVTKALLSPRDLDAAFTLGAGVRRIFSQHIDLNASLEALFPPIGKTFLQLPVAISIHPTR